MSKNKVKLRGFVSFPRNFGNKSTASLSVGFNISKKGEKPKWKNTYVKIEAELNKIDFTKMEGTQIGITGYLSGEAFTQKNSDKEITILKVIVGSVIVLEKGSSFKSSIELETRVSYIETFGENGLSGSAAVPFKAEGSEGYKYVNIRFVGKQDLNLKTGDIVVLNGFVTGDAYTPKNSDKEITKIKLYIMSKEVVERTKTSDDETPDTDGHVPAIKPTTDVPEIDVDEDEIPF